MIYTDQHDFDCPENLVLKFLQNETVLTVIRMIWRSFSSHLSPTMWSVITVCCIGFQRKKVITGIIPRSHFIGKEHETSCRGQVKLLSFFPSDFYKQGMKWLLRRFFYNHQDKNITRSIAFGAITKRPNGGGNMKTFLLSLLVKGLISPSDSQKYKIGSEQDWRQCRKQIWTPTCPSLNKARIGIKLDLTICSSCLQ